MLHATFTVRGRVTNRLQSRCLPRRAGTVRTLFRMTLLSLLGVSLPASRGAAQDTLPLLEVGTRVRLESRAQQFGPIAGGVVLSTPDSVGIQRGADLRYASRSELGRLQVSDGRDHGSGALKGAGWGAFLVAAPIVLFIVKERASGPAGPEGMDFSGALLINGTAAGAVIGAVIGGLVGSERWLTRWESRAGQ